MTATKKSAAKPPTADLEVIDPEVFLAELRELVPVVEVETLTEPPVAEVEPAVGEAAMAERPGADVVHVEDPVSRQLRLAQARRNRNHDFSVPQDEDLVVAKDPLDYVHGA